MKTFLTLTLMAASSVSATHSISAQNAPGAGAAKLHVIVALPGSIAWGPAPDILPAGARLGVVEGDPTKSGTYTMRLWMPAGYRLPPHTHPADEHVTVITGTFYVGMGEKFDTTKATELPTGTFAALAPGVRHFAFTRAETVIQLHGIGPWQLSYINPADDPRNRKNK
jgi:quercetin dioxygenase-like cupin family protein